MKGTAKAVPFFKKPQQIINKTYKNRYIYFCAKFRKKYAQHAFFCKDAPKYIYLFFYYSKKPSSQTEGVKITIDTKIKI